MVDQLDMQHFDSVFDRYKNLVYKTACLMLSDPSEAEDVLQDVFIRVYRLGGSYDPEKGSLATWIRRVTVNQCISKQKSGKHSYSLDEMRQNGHQPDEDEIDFDDKLALKLSIEKMLQSLSGKYRAALILRYVDDLTYEEIAETLDIPLGTVKSRINAAITTLRKSRKREVENELRTS